jgi:putative ABC transport system permease protein
MIAGARLAAKFPKLKPGGRIHFGRRDWNVVGVFSDAGSARESEIWTDLNLLAQEIHFGSGFSTLHIAMSPGRIESFSAALSADSRLNLDAMSEREFYSRQTQLADRLGAIAMLVAAIVGVGATFGAMNTMYSAVARRAREIGVLRAIGFGRGAIMLSFMIESIAIALAGGVAGELLAVGVAMGTGLTGRLMTAGTTTFSFRIAPSVFVSGLAAALGIGVAGGLIPAWRAARMRVIESIRAA